MHAIIVMSCKAHAHQQSDTCGVSQDDCALPSCDILDAEIARAVRCIQQSNIQLLCAHRCRPSGALYCDRSCAKVCQFFSVKMAAWVIPCNGRSVIAIAATCGGGHQQMLCCQAYCVARHTCQAYLTSHQ